MLSLSLQINLTVAIVITLLICDFNESAMQLFWVIFIWEMVTHFCDEDEDEDEEIVVNQQETRTETWVRQRAYMTSVPTSYALCAYDIMEWLHERECDVKVIDDVWKKMVLRTNVILLAKMWNLKNRMKGPYIIVKKTNVNHVITGNVKKLLKNQ